MEIFLMCGTLREIHSHYTYLVPNRPVISLYAVEPDTLGPVQEPALVLGLGFPHGGSLRIRVPALGPSPHTGLGQGIK